MFYYQLPFQATHVSLYAILKLYFFLIINIYYLTMKILSHQDFSNQYSSQSYGHQFRLRYKKDVNSANKQQKNRRISEIKKQRLIQMVTKENYRIKQAGRILGISYSTAKKIFTNFKKDLRPKKDSETGDEQKQVICGYRILSEEHGHETPALEIISSIAGKHQIPISEEIFVFDNK